MEGSYTSVMNYMINGDDGDIENVEKGTEVKAVDGWSGVNGDRVLESENQWEIESQSAEASALNTACEQRMEAGSELVKEVQGEGLNFSGQIEAGHQLKMLCGNGEIVSGNNEQCMVQVNDGDFGNEEMSRGLNVSNSDEKEDQTLFQVKGREFKTIDAWNGVTGDQAAESEDQCEQRTKGIKEQEEGRKEPLKEVQEESQTFSAQIEVSHHFEKHGEIDCANKEHYMIQVDADGDLEKEDEEMSRRLRISDRNDMEYQTLVQVEGREVEAIDGCNGVNGDQAAESESRCEVERISVEVSDQNKACEEGMEGFEEQNDGRRESLKKVQEGQNLSGQIEVAAEDEAAKGKLTKVVQKRRGQKRKRQKKTKRQIKVLKSDTPRPIMEDEKKYVEERHQIKGGSGLTKSAGKRERPRQGKMISEEVHPRDGKIDIRTKMRVLPCDRDVRTLKTSHAKRSDRQLEKQKKEALKHEEQQKRKLCDRKRGLFIVCALPASQSRTNIDPKAPKRLTHSTSASLESRESGEILLRQLKRSTPAKIRGLRRNTTKRFRLSEDLDLDKQEQQFLEPQKLQEYERKSKQANFVCEEAAVSPSIKVKVSMDHGHQMGSSIVCALPASQSRKNNNTKPLTDSTSASFESSEFGEILLRQLKLSSPRRPRGLRGNTSKRFTQSEPKPVGMSKGLELDKQEQQFREPKKLREDALKTKQLNFGGEEAMDQGHQMEQIKVYVRRSKSQRKEP